MTDSSPVAEIPEWPKRVVAIAHCYSFNIDGLTEEAQGKFNQAVSSPFLMTFDVAKNGTTRLIAIDDKPILDSYMAQRFNALEDSHAQRQNPASPQTATRA